MIKIIKAEYGNNNTYKDVKQFVEKYIINNKIYNLSVNNDTMGGDPLVGVPKHLKLTINYKDQEIEYIASEGEQFTYPVDKYIRENSLILTSCNRIDQVLLAIAVNKEIIKDDFNLIVVDCSTPEKDKTQAVYMHSSDDPYNLIHAHNYNPNWTEIENYVKNIKKIKKFKIIHIRPRMNKQIGEAHMTSIGINEAALMGSKYFLKLTGVCNLKYDFFQKFEEIIDDKSILTWRRTGFSEQVSTRVFAGRPDEVNKAFMNAGYAEWVREYDFIERKLGKVIEKYLKDSAIDQSVNERDILVDEGIGRSDHRSIITENLKKHNLLNSQDIIIQKFLNGAIW